MDIKITLTDGFVGHSSEIMTDYYLDFLSFERLVKESFNLNENKEYITASETFIRLLQLRVQERVYASVLISYKNEPFIIESDGSLSGNIEIMDRNLGLKLELLSNRNK